MEPNYSIKWSARLVGSSTVAKGDVLIPNEDGTYFVVATAANRGTRRAEGVSLTAYSGASVGSVDLQQAGTVDPVISGLTAGSASWVRVSATGRCERCTPSGSDDIIGWCEADGRLHLMMGVLTAAIVNGGGGGATPFQLGPGPYPTVGDGFRAGTGTLGSVGIISAWLPSISDLSEGDTGVSVVAVSDNGSGTGAVSFGSYSPDVGETVATSLIGNEITIFAESCPGYLKFSGPQSVGADRAGILATHRFSIGSQGVSNDSSFGGPAAGPMLKLHKIQTLPTDPAPAEINSAVWVWFRDSTPDRVEIVFPSGNILQLPDYNGAVSTSAGASTNGSSGDILRSDGAGGFGTALTPGAGIATFLATPSSANLLAALTDETGTGSAVFATSPTLTTPKIADSAGGQTYNFVVSNLAADRTVTLPLLAGNDTFVFEAHTQTLTNKTINGSNNTITNVSISSAVSGLASGITTFLTTPTSANLAAAVTNETGSGALVFGTSPTIATPNLSGPAVSDFVSIGATVPAAGYIRAAYSASNTLIAVKDSTAADRRLIGTYSADAWTFGLRSVLNVDYEGHVVNLFASNALSVYASSTLVWTSNAGTFLECALPLKGRSGSSVPFRLGSSAIAMTNGSNTATSTQYENVYLTLTTASGTPTELVLPNTQDATFNVLNSTGFAINLRKAAGSGGVSIANGAVRWIRHNGTDYEFRSS